MSLNEKFLCRELSLLEFNKRVLYQATNPQVPLLEQLRFICIVSSNLDEFFEVRISYLKRLIKQNPNTKLITGFTAIQTLDNVLKETSKLIKNQYEIFIDYIIPELRKNNIYFYKREEWTAKQKRWLESYFHREIKQIITPIGLDPAHPFPKVLNKSLNFIIELEGNDAFGRPTNLAIVQAPIILPQVINLPKHLCNNNDGFVFLSSILHANINSIFLGMSIKGCYQFRVTRDSELIVDEDDIKDLRQTIQGELIDREYGNEVRLEIDANCPEFLIQFLLEQFSLTEKDLFKVNGPVTLKRLMAIPDLINHNKLKYEQKIPGTLTNLKKSTSIFSYLKKKDIIMYHPYESFQTVVNFINNAALDSKVVAIKMTIYRTGNKSDLIKALIHAARSKKEVTVVVELMARFDEETNVNWASQLEESGAHVVYGVFGYKVHAKMTLVVRKENNRLVNYTHVSTGNYHQGTSKLYTDFGMITNNKQIASDVNDIFLQITGLGKAGKLQKIYQSPFTLHKMIIDSINKEIINKQNGKNAKIIAKMNSLIEPEIIEHLYKASCLGVKIDLIIRGICTLRPNIPNLSENITVISIVGRLLEHTRIFYFYNDNQEDLYISSADWMDRNFFRRVETCIPIIDKNAKQRILNEGLLLPLKDNVQAWVMASDGSYYKKTKQDNEEEFNIQEYLLEKYSKKINS